MYEGAGSGQCFCKPLANGMFRQGAHKFVGNFTVYKQLHGRDSPDAVLLHQVLMMIRVDFHQAPGAFAFTGQFFQRRSDDPAGAAPGRPEVNQYRLLMALFYDFNLEIRFFFCH